jgi:hypothetical protein
MWRNAKIKDRVFAGMLFLPIVISTPHSHPELWYQERWCDAHDGETEVVLPDKTRCDCVTATHAIEFDFGEKWPESIGQSLYYAMHLEKIPGVVLILEEENDRKYWIRLNSTIDHYALPIDTWETNEDDWFPPRTFDKISSWLHLLLKGKE